MPHAFITAETSMAYVLVKWLEEDRISIIPSSWVLQVTANELPAKGVCFWKKNRCI